ncbi:MAG: histidinol dehydrogenase, partial [Microbacteriaceae bacterium]
DLRGQRLSSDLVNSAVPRAELDISIALEQVKPLIEDIRKNGESAIIEVAKKFDGFDPRPLRVSQSELDAALEQLAAPLREAIEESIKRVRKVSAASMPQSVSVELGEGAYVHQRWQPVDSVGLYVPGGKAVYPSSVIMNVVPAQTAGVPRLAIATPAQAAFGGRPHPVVLATAKMLGVTEVYAIGGPAAVAAFAFGVPEIGLEPTMLVTGPGNIFVTAAKRAVRGVIGIDSEAGTTEILVLADATADARLIAFDLVSQAEHDEAAACVLVTDSARLIEDVEKWVAKIAEQTKHANRVTQALGAVQSALVLVDSQDAAIDFANHYATEHLEIHTDEPHVTLKRITNAGAIFLGKGSPVSLGDYLAGSNHVLPTGQQAKFGAGLGVHTFLRAQQVIDYNLEGLAAIATKVTVFADSEGLPAHGEAITARFD